MVLWFRIKICIYLWSSSSFLGLRDRKASEFPVLRGQSCPLFCEWGDFGKPPKDGGWLPGEPALWVEGWHFQPHPSLNSREGRGVRDWVQWLMANYFIDHGCITKLPEKPRRRGLESFWVGEILLFRWLSGKEPSCQCRRQDIGDLGLIPGCRTACGEGNGNTSPDFLPVKFHGQSCLVGYSSWGRKESVMTERPSNFCEWTCVDLCWCLEPLRSYPSMPCLCIS